VVESEGVDDDDGDAADDPTLALATVGDFGDVGFAEGVVARLTVDATVVAFAFRESLFVERETTSALYPETVCVTRFSNKSLFRNKA
jgi:hypothetical protein